MALAGSQIGRLPGRRTEACLRSWTSCSRSRRHTGKGLQVLQAILLAGIVAAPLGSVALFLPARQHARNTGTWPAIRRLTLAVIGTVVLAAVVAAILRELLHATR